MSTQVFDMNTQIDNGFLVYTTHINDLCHTHKVTFVTFLQQVS